MTTVSVHQVDTDGDGLIDYKEFRDMMLQVCGGAARDGSTTHTTWAQGNEYVNRVNSVIQSL